MNGKARGKQPALLNRVTCEPLKGPPRDAVRSAEGCDWPSAAPVTDEEAPLDESGSDCGALPHPRRPLAV